MHYTNIIHPLFHATSPICFDDPDTEILLDVTFGYRIHPDDPVEQEQTHSLYVDCYSVTANNKGQMLYSELKTACDQAAQEYIKSNYGECYYTDTYQFEVSDTFSHQLNP